EIKKTVLPQGVHITITRNYGAQANHAVNTLIGHLGISILAVVFILLVFLSWKESVIVAISIPLILCIVLGIGWVMGQTINRITLFALILSLGLLVDDSIVVIENIHRHHHTRSPNQFEILIIHAADEIGKPTIIATFTVILALIPMAFVTGMMGPFMGPIPFNAPIAMLASLLIAYTAVPYLAYKWIKPSPPIITHPSREKKNWVLNKYASIMRALLEFGRYRIIFFAGVILLLVLSLLQPVWPFIRPSGPNHPLGPIAVGVKMLPNDNVNTLLIEIDTQNGTPFEDTAKIADKVSHILSTTADVTNYQTFLGQAAPEDFAAMVRGDSSRAGPNFAQIRVNLLDKSSRKETSHMIARQLDKNMEPLRIAYPGTRIKILETPPGPPVRSQMMAALYGPNYSRLQALAKTLKNQIYPKIYGMANIDDSVNHPTREDKIRINAHAADLSGITPDYLNNQIDTEFKGRVITSLHQRNTIAPDNVLLRLPDSDRNNLQTLKNLYVVNPNGQAVALSDIA
ncbi:MAG: efflux RND transporter permease subunit, partial [Pseudomonadota bacterium]|nr:efflux RND transporter permease subunit [Pseudomonadota bacterium]